MIRKSNISAQRNIQRPLTIAVAFAFGLIHAGSVHAQEGEAKLQEMKSRRSPTSPFSSAPSWEK
jgi:hypothetical protein